MGELRVSLPLSACLAAVGECGVVEWWGDVLQRVSGGGLQAFAGVLPHVGLGWEFVLW